MKSSNALAEDTCMKLITEHHGCRFEGLILSAFLLW